MKPDGLAGDLDVGGSGPGRRRGNRRNRGGHVSYRRPRIKIYGRRRGNRRNRGGHSLGGPFRGGPAFPQRACLAHADRLAERIEVRDNGSSRRCRRFRGHIISKVDHHRLAVSRRVTKRSRPAVIARQIERDRVRWKAYWTGGYGRRRHMAQGRKGPPSRGISAQALQQALKFLFGPAVGFHGQQTQGGGVAVAEMHDANPLPHGFGLSGFRPHVEDQSHHLARRERRGLPGEKLRVKVLFDAALRLFHELTEPAFIQNFRQVMKKDAPILCRRPENIFGRVLQARQQSG